MKKIGGSEVSQLSREKRDRSAGCMFIVAFCFFFLTACSFQQGNKLQSSTDHGTQAKKSTSAGPITTSAWKLPLVVSNGEFAKGCGWLSNDQVVYVTNQEQMSSVYSYNLQTGKSKQLFKSDHPIVTVQISPAKKYLLIHSSPSTYEGTVTIIDLKGKVIWSHSLPSYELSFEWNPYNDSEIAISKFNEDWSFEVFLVNINGHSNTKLSLPQPFVKWMDKDHLAYINWDNDNPALFAPLVIKSLAGDPDQTIVSKVYQFSAFKHKLMTITIDEKDQSKAVYTFFDQNQQQLSQFSMPQLSKFSDWLVPNYDYIEQKGLFLTFRPLKSGEVDSYKDGFQLISHRLKGNKTTVIFPNLDNEPLNCSPSGNLCLYGTRFEKLIDVHSKKIIKWVKP